MSWKRNYKKTKPGLKPHFSLHRDLVFGDSVSSESLSSYCHGLFSYLQDRDTRTFNSHRDLHVMKSTNTKAEGGIK